LREATLTPDERMLVERFERGQTPDDLEDDGHGRDPVG
jgi:hypothetical protein